MTNFTYWQNKAGEQGKIMCQICFEAFDRDEMHQLETGMIEDACLPCWEYEQAEMKKRGML